ncbi:alpha-1,4-glucan branching enzyme, partial [Nowakowskiella sp. JEL0078]
TLRYYLYKQWVTKIETLEGGYDKFTRGYETFGLNAVEGGIRYREWAPGAKEAFLVGDFNDWKVGEYPLKKNEFGVWEIFIPNLSDGKPAIPHLSKIKVSSLDDQQNLLIDFSIQIKIITHDNIVIDRLPAWSKYVTQDLEKSPVYDAHFYNPPNPYKFKNQSPKIPKSLRIYEAHVGISSPEGKVSTYKYFTQNILPRLKYLGYNTIQLMAIMEHPYYASFGYQVTSFFAPSSRYGLPEDLKELIDTAHGMGLVVLLDVVHSHAAKNVLDGINQFDGTDHQYFHGGLKGHHELWDSRLFNYGHHEVLRFLLSNLRYWLSEFHFDGFRFDGVTSMLYLHHGIGTGFTGNYNEYFTEATDLEAVVYLMLANDFMRKIHPNIVTIAEDVSGMPTIGRPVQEGGIGFNYRLAMALPDMWIKLLKEKS